MNGLLYLNTNIFEDEDLIQKAMDMVSSERKEKISKLKNSVSVRLSLGAGVLLRIALDRNGLGEKINSIKMGEHGKPYLEGTDFYFSLSHSGQYAVCSYSDAPIGVDLQKIKDTFPKHTKKILSDAEITYLENLCEAEKKEWFYRLWAKKESLIKWDGRGLRLPLQELSFIEDQKIADKIEFEEKQLHFMEYDFLFPEYAVSICSENSDFPEEAEEITAKILIKD